MNTFLSMSLGGALMALLFCALFPILRRSIRARELLWLCLLCLLRFVLPLPGLLQPESRELILPAAPTQVQETLPVPTAQPAPIVTQETSETAVAARSVSFRKALPCLWALGSCTVLGVEISGYLRFRKKLLLTAKGCDEGEIALLRSLSGRDKIGMVRSPVCPVPMLLGPLHPLIVLPGNMDGGELENVLRHELCHRRLGHLYMKWFALFVCALHWFNPGAWLLRRQLEPLCELRCDEAVIEGMNPREKQSYGETLIRLSAAKAPRVLSTAATGDSREHLQQRLVQIMEGNRSKGRSLCLCLLCALLLVGCGSVVGKRRTVAPTLWTEDGNYYSTDGNVWYASSGDVAYYHYATSGNSFPAVYATNGNLYPDGMDSVTVGTAEELLEALTFYHHIYLRSGTYDLRDKTLGIHGHSYWKPDGLGHSLISEYAFNLTLEPEHSGDTVTILCDRWVWDSNNSYNVRNLRFEGSVRFLGNISGYFEGCTFSGGSVSAEQCFSLTFRNCAFENGCFGAVYTPALSLEDCRFTACQKPLLNNCDGSRLLRCTVDGEAVKQSELEVWGQLPEIGESEQ